MLKVRALLKPIRKIIKETPIIKIRIGNRTVNCSVHDKLFRRRTMPVSNYDITHINKSKQYKRIIEKQKQDGILRYI